MIPKETALSLARPSKAHKLSSPHFLLNQTLEQAHLIYNTIPIDLGPMMKLIQLVHLSLPIEEADSIKIVIDAGAI